MACGYRTTIARSSKNDSKNKKRENYKIMKTIKRKTEQISFCNLLLFLSHLASFILVFC